MPGYPVEGRDYPGYADPGRRRRSSPGRRALEEADIVVGRADEDADRGALDDERIDRLFALPPEDFVTERDALVKQLRGEDRPGLARRVAGLRRPTLAAWAVNQAVRAEPEAYAALREAGEQMRQALRRAMSGMKDADVGSATQTRRGRVGTLTATALGRLREAGHDAEAHREAVAATFDAASANHEAGAQVAAGRLSRPLERPSEFDELSPLALVDDGTATATSDGGGQSRARAGRERIEQARKRSAQAREEAARARREAEDAEHDAEAAEQEEAAARDRLERAQRAHEQARSKAHTARRAADRAREAADSAEDAARRREAELTELTAQPGS